LKTFYLWLLCWAATFSATLGLLWLTLDWTGLWLLAAGVVTAPFTMFLGLSLASLMSPIFHRDAEREEESGAATSQEVTARNSSRTTARLPVE
jgi:hypothetical protein